VAIFFLVAKWSQKNNCNEQFLWEFFKIIQIGVVKGYGFVDSKRHKNTYKILITTAL